MFVGDRRKRDLVPALADRKAAVVEKSAGPGFRKADQRHRLRDRAGAVADQRDEAFDRGRSRGQRLGDRFGRGPARAAVRRHALGLVEGRRIEPGLLGEAGGR